MEALRNAIFISYRRADLSQDQVNVIHEGLEKEFGHDSVFLDTSDIHGGAKWKQILNQAGTGAKICLVMMGKSWLEKDKDGRFRIQHPDDWVRKEIEYAIEKNLEIIPILVNGAELPSPTDVPASIHPMFDSQTMTLDLNRWSIYKEKFYKDIRILLQLEDKIEIKRIVRFDPKRFWFLLLIPVLIGLIYFLSKKNSGEKPKLITPSDSLTLSGPVCKPFDPNTEIKSLIFPIYSSDSQSAKTTRQLIEELFSDQCRQAGLIAENQFATLDHSIEITKSKKLELARSCGADLYYSGVLIKGGDQSLSIKSDFNLTSDTLGAYVPNPEDLRLNLTRFLMEDLIGDEVNEKIERLVQCIIGIFAYQKGHYALSVKTLKSALNSGIANDSLKKTAYRLITDAYYKMMDNDSCLYYQQQLVLNFPSAQATLKTAYLAHLYKKPEVAIPAYTELIENSRYDKGPLLEKRGDQYIQIKEYSKAKEDYNRVQKTENNKTRVNDKIKQVDKNISVNQATLSTINNLQASEQEKINAADKFLQIGQFVKANELLQTIDRSSVLYQKAEPLLQEAQLKINPATTIITETAVKANPRLNTEVGVKKVAVRKVN
ncbi:MAG: toll/interleukin-1 receptor domain-containing protein [Saprospiraceae bacterium]|nr:toll/interleukin-1 receptor domain-containing protein [Saprospiraceae bacterium]